MKKINTLILVSCVGFMLSGCGSSDALSTLTSNKWADSEKSCKDGFTHVWGNQYKTGSSWTMKGELQAETDQKTEFSLKNYADTGLSNDLIKIGKPEDYVVHTYKIYSTGNNLVSNLIGNDKVVTDTVALIKVEDDNITVTTSETKMDFDQMLKGRYVQKEVPTSVHSYVRCS